MKKYDVIISELAERDINEIITYYISMNMEFAKKLYAKIKAKILELSILPEKGRIPPELEKNGIHDFKEIIEGNYRIIYSIHGKSVHILTVVDSRRNLDEILVNKVIDYFE